MARTFSVEFNIGAAMGSGFRRTFSSAQDQMHELGASMRKMSKQRIAADNVRKYKQELEELRRKQGLAGHSNAALNRKISETRRKFAEASKEAKKHGVEIGRAAEQYDQLGAAMKQAERRQARLQKRQANQDARQNIQGQFMGVAAAGAAVAFPIKQAVEFESTMADVKKVVDFDDDKQFKKMGRDVLQLSRNMPMAASGIGDIVAAAGQANIAKDQLTAFAQTAVKMGTAFDLTGRQAGKIMASWRSGMGLTQKQTVNLADAVNHLSNNMNAEAADLAEVIQRQGAAAKTAGLAENEIASLGAALLSGGAAPQIAATAMKKLTNSLTQGAKAPKRIKDSLSELGFSAEGMAQKMQKDAPAAIKSVFAALKELPKAARPGMIKELFGEESQGAIAPLLENMEKVHKAFGLTADKAKFVGSMQKEYKERTQTTAAQMQNFRNRVSALGITLGGVLLPPLNKVMTVVGKSVGKFADLAAEFPTVTKVVIGAAAGLVAFKVATMGARYGMTLVSDAAQFGKAAFDFFRPSVMKTNLALARQKVAAVGLAAKQRALGVATKALTVAQWAWNTAFGASPIGLVIGGVIALGVAGAALMKYWEPVKGFFKGLWSGLVAGIKPIYEAIKPIFVIFKPLAPLTKAVGSAFGWAANKIGQVTSWFGNLLAPVDASAKSVDRATAAGKRFGQAIGGIVQKSIGIMKSAFLNFTPLGWVIQAFNPVKNWLSNFNLFDSGKKIVGTLVGGIKSMIGEPKKMIGSAFKKVRELLPFSDAKKGPLSDLTKSGRAIGSTISQGIKQSSPDLARTTQGAMAGVRSGVSAAGSNRSGRGGTAIYQTINQTINLGSDDGATTEQIKSAGNQAAAKAKEAVQQLFKDERRLSFA
jgi:TP901 family phage tail tape measure protein